MKFLHCQASFAIDWRGTNQDKLCFVFHGATKPMLVNVFDLFKGNLYKDYSVGFETMPAMLQGKCYANRVVSIKEPNQNMLNVEEWPMLIKKLIEDNYRWSVTYFQNYEKFLNT